MKLPAQRVLGAGLVSVAVCVLALAISGLLLTRIYEPTAKGAFLSLQATSNGYKALQAVHYWIAFFAVLSAGLTIFGMLWYGWWRQARTLWWTALALGLVVYASQVTGKPLPVTQHDARTILTEARIAGSAPILGPTLKELLLPGGAVQDATVERWYRLHRLISGSAAALLSLAIVIWAWRKRVPAGGYWCFSPLILGLLFAATFGNPSGTPATDSDLRLGGPVGPMWYAVPMHALLKWMQALDPSLGWVGAIGIPSAFLALAGLLPFLGRGKWAIVWTRGFGLALALFVVVAFAQFGSQMQSPFSRALASAETDTASEDAPTESDAETVDARRRELGARLFQREGCRNCHSIGGEGANGPGPALDGIGDERRSRAWFVSFLKDPSSQGATLMPPYGHLSAEELNALAEFLWSQKRK